MGVNNNQGANTNNNANVNTNAPETFFKLPEELIKEFVSHGKKILNIDKKAYTFIKPKENKNENN